ncbi:Ferric reductase like transmembrane component-containing protein 5 [Elsinoe fawcettii]|nr:Ferric reductase like transmembrane component-containing protein 5 [Elsinoe fawcettii]
MAAHMASILPRKIQDFANAKVTEPHWGYAERVIPCSNDKGSCEYLDVIYGSHDLGMIYTAVSWAVLVAIFGSWALIRLISRPGKGSQGPIEKVGGINKVLRSLAASTRRRFLPEFGGVGRTIFSRTTRLQITILAVLAGYLLIFSFVGMRFAKWVTPVKAHPGHFNTRTTIGPWANRVGVLAYALTPFSIFLASRESVLSLATGLPYQSFNFLHRWLGYIILVQSMLHTMGWIIIEVWLYQPQPMTAIHIFSEKYIIMGIVAQFLILVLFVLSLSPVIRWTGYEFFRKAHYILAMLFIGFCWAHWSKLYCFMLASLILWGVDRGLRLLRTAWLHFRPSKNSSMFESAKATFTAFPDDVNGDIIRISFPHSRASFKIGQHFYLTFPRITLWQSHPFTPLSLPDKLNGHVQHDYLFRAKKGETRRLALTARAQGGLVDVPVILSGAYGTAITNRLGSEANILCIAGGTGITFVLPILLDLINKSPVEGRKITLVWAVRTRGDVRWVADELARVRDAEGTHGIEVKIFVTRDNTRQKIVTIGEKGEESGSESGDEEEMADGRPELGEVVRGFVRDVVRGRTAVYASGPGEMITELRREVAGVNDGGKVWRGDSRGDVELTCDDRLEW